MITAGVPWVFYPLGRAHLTLHPGDVYLPEEVTPAVPTACGLDFSQDLLRALQGVTLKDQPEKEGWCLRECPEGEEELYFSGKTVVWSRSSGHGVHNILKTFTLENPVCQVLWTEFNLCCSKPRRMEPLSEIPEDTSRSSVMSGLCAIQLTTVTVFTESGENYLASIPFQVSRAWSTKYGLLLERDVYDSTQSSKRDPYDVAPVIFSMLHPLDEVSPVIKKMGVPSAAVKLSYFCNESEIIVFSSPNPSLVVTFNKVEGTHTVWKLRTTSFEEADFACSKTLLESQFGPKTPVEQSTSTHLANSSSHSRFTTHSYTPSNTCSPYRSYASSRVASPSFNQSSSVSPITSGLTHMAALSRSCSPTASSTLSRRYTFTPALSNVSQKSPSSPLQNSISCEFMDPLAPDLCFDHEWTEYHGAGEAATKVFLSKDSTGHSFLCYLLKKQQQLRLIKFEESNDSSQWIFGTTSVIPALDAEGFSSLNLIITLECNFTLSLYTGPIKVSKVYISDLFAPFSDLHSMSNSRDHSTTFETPRRCSLVTSTRPTTPMNPKFGDEVLSPVAKCEISPPKVLHLGDDICPTIGVFKGLRDAVGNKVTLEATNGYFRVPLPKVAESATVNTCLSALHAVLPRDIYTTVFVKWYCTRNAPGPSDMTCESELNAFLTCLLGIIGYDTEGICLGGYSNSDSSCSFDFIKKQKRNECGSDDDWNYLLSSNFHNSVWSSNSAHWIGLQPIACKLFSPVKERFPINTSATLLPYIAHVLFSLHLVYEDCKMNVMQWIDLPQLASFLFELARDLRQEKYMEHYWQDFPEQFRSVTLKYLLPEDQYKKIHFPNYFFPPPCIYSWIQNTFQYTDPSSFPYIPNVTHSLKNVVLAYVLLTEPEFSLDLAEKYLTKVFASGTRVHDDITTISLTNHFKPLSDPKKAAVLFLSKLGMTAEDVDVLPIGVTLAMRDAILHCRHNPMSEWLGDTYNFIGRQDLMALHLVEKDKKPLTIRKCKNTYETIKQSLAKDCEDGFQYLDLEVIFLRFSKDLRICDVCHMLQSSKPVRISVQQRPEVSDHEFIEEQERHLYSLCIRTMALPVGRGMLTLQTYTPVVTETLPIPKLCLIGRAPPRNATVDLSHIDIPPNMNMWPLFHNGVAAGLRIMPNASQIDSTWMVYNKPRSSSNDTPTEHAGFLMALGLNGHLSNLATISIHDYLCKGHELTSVGILLGVAIAKRGTMDLGVTKLLSIHIEALLPPTSTELDVPPVVQVAAVMGIGLLYQGSAHHHMAEVMLGEIGRPPGPEMEHCVDRESYSLAAGLSLGLITFGKGKDVSGLTDLPMADQLYHYMVGGHKRPLTGVHKEKHKSPSYQIREGDSVNVDVTSPGATLALGMMFFDSDNHSIADWMAAPDTQFLLDMVRPDFLLLRTVSRGLILWSSVYPSKSWVESHVPEIVLKHAFKRNVTNADVDYETMSQAYCNIIAGSCMCLGLKFAGSANDEAFSTLMFYAKFFLSLTRKSAGDQAGRSTIETCLNVSVLALAMVMAGTGDLDVMRLCRHLRSRVGQASSYVLYGSHIATHMALGLLFLGGGRFTLSTSPLAIGCMLCAFYPKFPTHSNDNRYHLQALYHLYVLAAEPRLIIPRHLDSHQPVYTHVQISFKDTPWYQNVEYKIKAPCLLPELKLLKQVAVEDSRYWPIVFHCDKNWDVLLNLLHNGGNLFLKQKAGCLPYSEDPQGFRSLMAQTYITDSVHGWNLKNVSVSKFSSDPLALHFATKFLQTTAKNNKEKIWQQKVCSLLFECASQEKMDILPVYVMLIQMAEELCWKYQTQTLWQVKLLSVYREFSSKESVNENVHNSLLRPEFAGTVYKDVEKRLKDDADKIREHIRQYFGEGGNFSSVLPSDSSSILAAFLLYYNIPQKETKVLELYGDSVSVPGIFTQLSEFNPVGSTILTLSSVLSCKQASHS